VAALRKAFIETNLGIHTRGQQNREFEGMGTTATAILLRPEGAWIGHVGDSRAYRIRDGTIEQLSFDHSLVWELARRQKKDPDELQGIPSNVIVRSLGPEPLVQVDVEGPHPVRRGDLFLLCSDGLSGPVTDREIGAIASALPPEEACRFLVHLANLQGGPDNITAVIVRVGKASVDTSVNGALVGGPLAQLESSSILAQISKRIWPFACLLLGILLAIGAIVLTYHNLPYKIPTFLLAALALGAGLIGLLVQGLHDQRAQEVEPYVPRTKVYRQTPCAVDRPFVQRLGEAVGELEDRIRDRQWQADWDACRAQRGQADRLFQQGNLIDAFRGYCHAMMILMNAVQQQRGKKETFKPLWDQPSN
jgi:protein phosphatase